MDKAAAQVANVAIERQKTEPGAAATVDISPRARALAGVAGEPTADVADGLVNQKIAKHLSAANVKVLQSTDEMLRELTARR